MLDAKLEAVLRRLERLEGLEDRLERSMRRCIDQHFAKGKEWFTAKEVAAILQVRPDSVQRALRDGRIRGVKCKLASGPHAQWRIPRSEVARLEAGGLEPPGAGAAVMAGPLPVNGNGGARS